MATEFYPSITPVTLSNTPSKEVLLKVMVPLIEESESWKLGKLFDEPKFNLKIQTFSRNKTSQDRAMWHGRVTDHSKESVGGFEPFWNGIGVNHSLHEKEYFHELDDAKLVKRVAEDQEIWTLHYSLRPPASNRLFTELITTHVDTDSSTGLRTGYVMSIPIDVTSDSELAKEEFSATRGYYAAVERVKELPDGGVNWRMITTSTPGGYIPQFVVEGTMPGKIKEDVGLFLGWLVAKQGTSDSA